MCALYDVVGADKVATPAELRLAFKRRALAVHPDKGGTKEAFQQALAAFEFLMDPTKRADYDQRLDMNQTASVLICNPEKAAGVPEKTRKCSRRSAGKPPRGGGPPRPAKRCRHSASGVPPKTDSRSAASWQREGIPLVAKLYRLLQSAAADQRRRLIAELLPEGLRRALEDWVLAENAGNATPSGSLELDCISQDTSSNDEEDQEQEEIVDCINNYATGRCHLEQDALQMTVQQVPMALCDARGSDSESTDHESFGQVLQPLQGKSSASDTSHHMLEDLPSTVPTQHTHGTPRGIVKTRGLSSTIKSGVRYYWGFQSLGFFGITSRTTTDLELALDYLVVLTAAKQHALKLIADKNLSFEASIQQGVSEALDEAEVNGAEMGLRFQIFLTKSFWIGRRNHLWLKTMQSLDTALKYWRRFADLQSKISCSSGSVHTNLLTRCSPAELEQHWHEFQEAYLDVCEEQGQDRDDVYRRLQNLLEAREPHREKQLERWNTRRMNREEKRQCRAEAAAARIRRAVALLVDKWNRRQIAKTNQETAAKVRQYRKMQAAAAQESRRLLAERKERWRRMNRREITMGELLGGQPA